MINVIISFEVKERALSKVKELIKIFIAEIKNNEPDTYTYRSFQNSENPTKFMHIMTFANEEAQNIHRNSKYCQDFVAELYPECVSEPVAVSYDEV